MDTFDTLIITLQSNGNTLSEPFAKLGYKNKENPERSVLLIVERGFRKN